MTEIFAEDFADQLPEDPVLACVAICDAVIEFNKANVEQAGEEAWARDHQAYLQAIALFEVFAETRVLDLNYEWPELETDPASNARSIVRFFTDLKSSLDQRVIKMDLARFRQAYSIKFGQTIAYEFTGEESARIRHSIHELRLLIGDLQKLEERQRARLLNRLGKVYERLGTPLADLDLFWGLIGEALIVDARHGDDGTTIVECIDDIVDTARRAQARAEGIEVTGDAPRSLEERGYLSYYKVLN